MKNQWDKHIEPETNPYFWDDKPQHIESLKKPPETGYFMVDLFSGCGGFSTGFKWAGSTPILGIDIHPPSLETFRHNHIHAGVIKGNIRGVQSDLLRKAIGNKHISVLAAGVPCQGFSLCNRKRHPNDKRNFLFLEFTRCIKILKPDCVLLENVSGLLSTASGLFKREISLAIEECGYDVDFQMLNAADYGVPQQRQRVFFMGVKRGLEIRWPLPTHSSGKEKTVVVWDAIGDLPSLKVGESKHEYDKAPFSDYQKLMRDKCNKLKNHVAPKHFKEVVDKIRSTKPGNSIYPKFKQRIRLSPDEPSPTQVSGGIRPQYQFGHPTQPRGLTVRERCRIQSFSDDFEIFGGTVQGRIQTGNAVPPLLAYSIAKQIIRALKGDKTTEETLPKKAAQVELWSHKKLSMEKTGL